MELSDRYERRRSIRGPVESICVPTENKMGKAFMNCEVSFVGWAQEEDYKAAEALYEQYS